LKIGNFNRNHPGYRSITKSWFN